MKIAHCVRQRGSRRLPKQPADEMVSQYAVIVWESDLVSDSRCVECLRRRWRALLPDRERAKAILSIWLAEKVDRGWYFFCMRVRIGFFVTFLSDHFHAVDDCSSLTIKKWGLHSSKSASHWVAPLRRPPPLSRIKGLCIFRCTCIQISISSRITHSLTECLRRHWWENHTIFLASIYSSRFSFLLI